jgi:hypothetical protein
VDGVLEEWQQEAGIEIQKKIFAGEDAWKIGRPLLREMKGLGWKTEN